MVHQVSNVCQPQESFHIMLQGMKAQIDDLVMSVQAPGWLSFKRYNRGPVVDMILAFWEQEGSGSDAISAQDMGTQVKSGEASPEGVGVELVSFIATLVENAYDMRVVIFQYPQINICHGPQAKIIIYLLQEDNTLKEDYLNLFFIQFMEDLL